MLRSIAGATSSGGGGGPTSTQRSGARGPPQVWDAGHVKGFAPTHAPAVHVSVRVHGFPSSHAVPLGFGGFEHPPVAGLQVPTSWHESSAVQATGFDPTHTPAWHVS